MTPRRLLGLVCVATLLLTAPTACSDDDSSDLCATLDSLDAAMVDVDDVDIDQDVLARLEAETGDVRTDLEEIRAEASEDYSTQIDAVEQALENLTSSLDAAGTSPTAAARAEVGTAAEALDRAVDDLDDALDDTC
ncbi:hypothetical protein [Nocardioides ochotonae]|uniref:hypothetical protein n=1 Tax=Nocardioides ochotonae TaxID=2685869 RepID=UPI00140D11BA|nr:hypothetical protein [Nocardioides ochotonae]